MTAVRGLLHAVRRREQLADATFAFARLGLPTALALAAIAIATLRLAGAPKAVLWIAFAPFPVIAAWALTRRRSWRATARRVDHHYALADRLGSAYEFAEHPPRSEDPRTASIVLLLQSQAEAAASGLDPRPVVPVTIPAPRWRDAAALALVGLAIVLPAPRAQVLVPRLSAPDLRAWAPATSRTPVDLSLADPLRQSLRALTGSGDVAAETAAGILEILGQLERGELDRQAALAALEALEQALADTEVQFEAALEEDPGMLADAMQDLAAALRAHEITEEAGQALAHEHGEESEAALQDAAESAEADPSQREDLRDAMQDAARALERSAGQETSTAAALDEAERRLRKDQAESKAGETPQERERRLKKQERRVEELRRQHAREEAARRQLEQLQRDARDAARGGGAGQGAERRSVERLARGARDASGQSRQASRLRQTRDGIEEAKSIVRRAGQKGDAQKRRQQQFKRFAQAAKGQKQDGKPGSTLLVPGELGEGEPMMMGEEGTPQPGSADDGRPGDGFADEGAQGEDPGAAQPTEQDGSAGHGTEGQGEGSVDPLADPRADPRDRSVRLRDVHVEAQRGHGVSRAEVIRESSQRGFANEDYRDVYTSYRAFAQSTLDNEVVPAARRRAIQRYYQLIAPRAHQD